VARDTLFDLRNRLLGSATFRAWAQKLPITRGVARRRANALFGLASGFIHSQVLQACVRLDLFERLAGGAVPAATLAEAHGLDPERLAHLLRAAAALDLLEARADDRYGLGPLGAAMVDNRSVTAMVEHHALLYADLEDPLAIYRGDAQTRLSTLWPYAAGGDPERLDAADVSAYTTLMAESQAMIAEQVLDAVALGDCRTLLDVGGGAGAFVSAAAARWPDLQLTIADLPGVADIATQRISAAGLDRRVTVVGVDAAAEPLPGGFDVVSLIRILHDHDDERAVALLGAARRALGAGGRLVVAEPMAGPGRAGALIDAYFNVYLLAMGSGRPRTAGQLTALLERAGFRDVRRRPTRVPLLTSVLVGNP